jgi:hypothetical protein
MVSQLVDWKAQLLVDVTVESKADKMDQRWVESWVDWSAILKAEHLVALTDDSMVERLDIEMVVTWVGPKGYSEVVVSDGMMEKRWAYKSAFELAA